MRPNQLQRSTGNWVDGERFWDREPEMELFAERMEQGAHLLIAAPRRIGKTSLMKEAARRLSGHYLCLFVDLQKAHSAEDAIVELSMAAHAHAPLWEKAKGLFHNVLSILPAEVKFHELAVTLRTGLTSGYWQAKGDDLFSILAGHEKPVILLMDEISILANRLLKGSNHRVTAERRRETDAFLSWLRANSMRHQGKIRIVLAGSIGLEPIARQAGCSAHLNTFTPFHMGPWSHEVALDWYAQADDGSVWYLGEDVFNYDAGVVADTHGTWQAGREGPAAMIMPGDPQVGNVYRPENAPGVVFEEVTVQSIDRTVHGPLGPIDGAIVTQELHMDATTEGKIFAPGY